MQLSELTARLDGLTTLQQKRLIEELAGSEVEIRSMICDVKSDNVHLDFIAGGTLEDKGDWEILVYFDAEHFGEELLAYAYGEDVVVVARLRSTEFRPPTLNFDLRSIEKTGTTFKTRTANRERAEAARCFIATACCGDSDGNEIRVLRRLRDDVLATRWPGRAIVTLYERYSPPVAVMLKRRRWLRIAVRRFCIAPVVRCLEWRYPELRES